MNLLIGSDFLKFVKVLNRKEIFYLLISFVLSLIIVSIEMVGISIVPIAIVNFLNFEQTVFDNFLFDYIQTLNFKIFLALICILFLLKSCLTYLHQLYDYVIIKRIRISIANRVYQKNLKKDYLELIKTPSSAKIWLIDNTSIFAKLISVYLVFFKSIILISVVSIFISAVNIGYFIIFYSCLFVLIILFYFFVKRRLENAGKNDLLAQKEVKKVIQESFEGIKNLIIYNQFNFFNKNFKSAFNKREVYSQKAFIISQFPANFIEFIAVSFFCLYVLISYNQDVNNGNFIYTLGLISYGSFRILSFVKLAINSFNIIKEKRYATSYILNEINLEDSFLDRRKFLKFSKKSENKNNILEIKDLTFKYENKTKLVFNDLNYKFKNKQFYIIKGESGEGKSTLIDLLMGIINPDTGSVTYNLENLNIGYVSQECFIVNDTLKKNIAFGIDEKLIDENKIKNILNDVKLEDHFTHDKDGIGTILNSQGSNISVGQKQRIGIARSLYFDPDILFLDEPTSALDKENEEIIMNILNKLSQKITVIMISHKDKSEYSSMETLILKNGRLIKN